MMSRLIMSVLMILGINLDGVAANKDAEQFYVDGVEKNQAGLLIEASVLLTEAISLDDQQARYFHQRGLSFIDMGEINQGIKDFKQAVDLKSDELSVYLKLISHYMKQSQYMLVLIITDQMLVILPEQAAGAYYDKGRAYEAMSKPHLAIKAYQASVNELGSEQAEFKQMLIQRITEINQQEKTP